MPFESLSKTLSLKPRVLAGPLLRKVTPNSVTVWLALRVGATVTLEVLGAGGPFEGERHTVAVGENLHLVAVTATPKETTKPLTEGVVYRYDLTFVYDSPLPLPFETLALATDNAVLAYPPFDEPTFCLPPADVNNLRLIHGSCRIPHGDGEDMLPLVGQLISQTAETPLQRPHQLLLMGDQIYADDVAASMLVMLTDASDVLLGWQEVLPVPPRWAGLDRAHKLSPFMRDGMLRASGFTSEDLDSHLMALGEYICMYLFVWSDVLWSVANIPSYADVIANVRANRGLEPVPPERLPRVDPFKEPIGWLTLFHGGLAEVRRVLANIPSYMIYDDHEVTDDWNMTLDICLKLYGNALGRRVVKNALVAYSLFTATPRRQRKHRSRLAPRAAVAVRREHPARLAVRPHPGAMR